MIIDSILAEGGDPTSGYFGGHFKEVAESRVSSFQNYGKRSAKLGIICPQKGIWKPLSPQARGCGNDILSEKGKTCRLIKEDLDTYCFSWRDISSCNWKCR